MKAEAVVKKEPDAKPIYQVDVSKLPLPSAVKDIGEVTDCSLPWLAASSKEVEDCCTQMNVAKPLAAFGDQYKRGQDYTTAGRSSCPLPSNCKREADAFFKTHSPEDVMDISDIPQGPGFMSTSFKWGFAPDMKWVGLAPTAAALIRSVCVGEARQRHTHTTYAHQPHRTHHSLPLSSSLSGLLSLLPFIHEHCRAAFPVIVTVVMCSLTLSCSVSRVLSFTH